MDMGRMKIVFCPCPIYIHIVIMTLLSSPLSVHDIIKKLLHITLISCECRLVDLDAKAVGTSMCMLSHNCHTKYRSVSLSRDMCRSRLCGNIDLPAKTFTAVIILRIHRPWYCKMALRRHSGDGKTSDYGTFLYFHNYAVAQRLIRATWQNVPSYFA
ncbi:hypothetical protein AcW1_010260 [Taiwanofungus camphoratus]|nr:hypothetical protein AcW1_005172 [Antrodia cinnamomea]KAI0944427.1 hypothetical protein AcW1_010260 [Antrodia cinnamomea]